MPRDDQRQRCDIGRGVRVGVEPPLNERHLKRVLSDYVRYYHEDGTHLGRNKETPNGRRRLVPTELLIVGWAACTTAMIAQREIREGKGLQVLSLVSLLSEAS